MLVADATSTATTAPPAVTEIPPFTVSTSVKVTPSVSVMVMLPAALAVASILAAVVSRTMAPAASAVRTSAVIFPAPSVMAAAEFSTTSPAVVPAFTIPAVMSPAIVVIDISLASLSVKDAASTATTAPPAVTVIPPFAVSTSVKVTPSVSLIKILPALVLLTSIDAAVVLTSFRAAPTEPCTVAVNTSQVMVLLPSLSVTDCPATVSAVKVTSLPRPPAVTVSTSMLPADAVTVMFPLVVIPLFTVMAFDSFTVRLFAAIVAVRVLIPVCRVVLPPALPLFTYRSSEVRVRILPETSTISVVAVNRKSPVPAFSPASGRIIVPPELRARLSFPVKVNVPAPASIYPVAARIALPWLTPPITIVPVIVRSPVWLILIVLPAAEVLTLVMLVICTSIGSPVSVAKAVIVPA